MPRGRRSTKKITRRTYRKRAAGMYLRKGTAQARYIKRIAQKVVNANVEHKECQYSQSKNILPAAAATGGQDNNVIPIHPYSGFMALNQGVGDGSRVGNSIKITNASMNFSIFPSPYNATTMVNPRPQNVMFIAFYDRNYTTSIPQPTANIDFYNNNNSTTTFTGVLSDLTRWINFDRYKVFYKKIFKLGFASNSGTGANPAFQNYNNNDYKLNILNFKFNYTKYLVKRTKFNDNNSIPTTRGLYCMWISVPCDNSPWGSGEIPCTVSYQMHMKYEDA